jgi:hypothetical protein
MRSHFFASAALSAAFFLSLASVNAESPVAAQQASEVAARAGERPETVEWVYRVQYGHRDEWFRIFRKYQIAILDRQKQLGYVKEYTVWSPSLHTSEDSRWDYRVVITRVSHDPPPGQSEEDVGKQLFPDQETFHREENRRWELTANHWDLPIHLVNLNANE